MRKQYPAFLFVSLLFLLAQSRVSAHTIDTSLGCTAPKAEARNAERLAHYLCDGLSTEREKANAIYNWITHNIRYDIKAFVSGKLSHDKVPSVLRRRQGICEGYADLFTEMSRAAGLQAVTIEGYARDWIFDDGDKLYVPRHTWNAVLVDGRWQLVDATWGAGGSVQRPGWVRRQFAKLSKKTSPATGKLRFVFHYDTSYFLQDPEAFRFTHLPVDPLWQLTDTAMPAYVFEAGDSAIRAFNEISKPAQNTEFLSMLASRPDLLRVYEYADRATAFNPYFYIPGALKHQVEAELQLSDSLNLHSDVPAAERYRQAGIALKQSGECIKKQQEGYNAEARDLKRKNTQKNAAAKKDIRELRADNKRLTAQCSLKSRAARTKLQQVSTKQAALARKAADKAVQPKKSKDPAKYSSAELALALDSTEARSTQIKTLHAQGDSLNAALSTALTINDQRLDSMRTLMMLSDSLLVQETIARIRMHDNYDREVITARQQFALAKYRDADSMQRRYLRAYDALLVQYDAQRRLDDAMLTVYKTSLRTLSKWAQAGGPAQAQKQYNTVRSEWTEAIQNAAQHLDAYKHAIRENNVVFNALEQLYKRQDKLAGYMEQAEGRRKQLEGKTLEKKAAFNKRETKQQESALGKSEQRLKKAAG